jgi:hypothetical protein
MPAALDQGGFLTPERHDLLLKAMWEQRKDICDLDADVLDALSTLWIHKSKGPDTSASAEIDELIEMRGLKRHAGGQGRRGGFTSKQRAAMLEALSHLHNVWMNVEIEVFESGRRSRPKKKREVMQSRAFVVTDRFGQLTLNGYLDVYKFVFRPGLVFGASLWGPARQVALLSAKALAWHPRRRRWEKRLARYFSWLWRIRAKKPDGQQPYGVRVLLEVVGEKLPGRNIKRLRKRFERALVTLQDEQVIAEWRYGQDFLPSKVGWAKRWLESSIVVEPPASIRSAYLDISGLGS